MNWLDRDRQVTQRVTRNTSRPKGKLSGLNGPGIELSQAYDILIKLQASFRFEQVDEGAGDRDCFDKKWVH